MQVSRNGMKSTSSDHCLLHLAQRNHASGTGIWGQQVRHASDIAFTVFSEGRRKVSARHRQPVDEVPLREFANIGNSWVGPCAPVTKSGFEKYSTMPPNGLAKYQKYAEEIG